nr:glycosyltransferase [Lachnospiraceae bacterium]
IDTTGVSGRSKIHGFEVLNLVAVANVAPWHGYDRLIESMGRYYQGGGKENCVFHLVGGGAEVGRYQELVSKWNLGEHVVFHGSLYGKALDDLYDVMDLAVETLGMHRKGIALSSSLKSKEYALKGLPILTSCKLDAFPEEACEFVLMLPQGEQEICFHEILDFYKKLYYDENSGSWSLDKKKELTAYISDYAKEHCDMYVTMQDTVQKLKGIPTKEI